MKYVLHPSRVSNTTRHCYSFVVGLLFGLTCFGLVYVIRLLRTYQYFASLSPWGNIWGTQEFDSVLNEKCAPGVGNLTSNPHLVSSPGLVSRSQTTFFLLYWGGKWSGYARLVQGIV